jgi:predicted porin
MKKSLIALAVLASSGAAMAQSTVTLFGTLDPGVWNQKTTLGNGASSSQTLLGNNGRGTTQVSVKGVAEISAGLNGIFLYEGDVNVGSSTGSAGSTSTASPTPAVGTTGQSGQHAIGSNGGEVFGGLQGGFGSIKLGSPNTPTLNSQASRQPMGTKIGGGFNSSLGTGHVRNDNSLVYATPDFGGLTVSAGYAFKSVIGQTVAGVKTTNDIGSILDLGVDAVFGPAKVGVTQYNQKKANTDASDHKQTNIYGQFAVATSTIYAGYVNQTAASSGAKASGLNLAVKVGLGDISLLGNIAKLNDKSAANNDKTTIGVGADYALGKRTTLYTRLVSEKTSNLASTSTSAAKVNSFLVGTQVNF